MSKKVFKHKLKKKITNVLQSKGFNSHEIEAANNSWEFASLSEKYSHGYDRISWLLEMVKQEKVRPNSPISFTKKGIISHIYGEKSLGYMAALDAVRSVTNTAKDQGIGITTIVDCYPTGCMSEYTEALAKENLIGIAISHSPLRVAAYGTADAIFGTTGHSLGFPSDTIPYIYDSSVGAMTNGEIMRHYTTKTPFPKDTVFTQEGKVAKNPSDVIDKNGIFNGIIAIAGGRDAHKISGLAGSLELLTQLALISRKIDVNSSAYSLFIALNPSFFGDIDIYKIFVTKLEKQILNARKQNSVEAVYFAGQKSHNLRNKNAQLKTVLISDKTYKLLF